MDAQLFARARALARLREPRTWDLIVIGGGATGLGVALDATVRGFSVALLESADFASGTSSRATKLAHGGVRYLAQGNVGLVREALRERTAMLANAPHLAQPLAFVVPGYKLWELPFYGTGLKLYGALAGNRSLGPTQMLSSRGTQAALPNVRMAGLVGGIKYWDGQFDDARLATTLARTALVRGACVLNHVAVTALLRDAGKVRGVRSRDQETGEVFELHARCVVNAAGVWVDALRDMDRADDAPHKAPMVAPSQGVHLVVDRTFMPGNHALMVLKTADGRVLFVVPWLGKVILGTTDTPRHDLPREPTPFPQEVEFILGEAARYLQKAPGRQDVRSVWVGLRPLVKPADDEGASTKALSREHTVIVSPSGLVTVTGGKWTTYRAMAEDVLEQCMARGLLPHTSGGRTEHLPLLGAANARAMCHAPGEHSYGAEAALLRSLPGAGRWLWRAGEAERSGLNEAMVRFALRYEMARGIEDVLARRCRLLFLDARHAAAVASDVAAIIEDETQRAVPEQESRDFAALAQQYSTLP